MTQIQKSPPPPRITAKGCLGGFRARLIAVLFVMGLGIGQVDAKVSAAQEGQFQSAQPAQGQTAPEQNKATGARLTCFTIQPTNPEKVKAPRSCDSYCMEKVAICTGVQSNIGPPPSCEDGMFKGSGSCRCCKVRP